MSNYWSKSFDLIIADIFSIITISSCLFIKVPQIRTIRTNKSARGINVIGLCLELFSYTVMTSYNYSSAYDFLSYMEYPILLVQEYFLMYYVLLYKNMLGKKTQITTVLYAVVSTLIYFKIVPVLVISFLVSSLKFKKKSEETSLRSKKSRSRKQKFFIFEPFCTPVGATSKALQLLSILRLKDASSISRTTWALSALTNITRIYTVYVLYHDWMLLLNFLISAFLSSGVFIAACIYKTEKMSKTE